MDPGSNIFHFLLAVGTGEYYMPMKLAWRWSVDFTPAMLTILNICKVLLRSLIKQKERKSRNRSSKLRKIWITGLVNSKTFELLRSCELKLSRSTRTWQSCEYVTIACLIRVSELEPGKVKKIQRTRLTSPSKYRQNAPQQQDTCEHLWHAYW